MEQIAPILETLSKHFDSQCKELNTLRYAATQHDQQVQLLQQENENLKTMNSYLFNDKERLEKQVENLEEEHRNFTKVSRIIALENENIKLKQELELLQNSKTLKPKVINGIEYWIDIDKNIYNGDKVKVGYLEKDVANGKTRARWL